MTNIYPKAVSKKLKIMFILRYFRCLDTRSSRFSNGCEGNVWLSITSGHWKCLDIKKEPSSVEQRAVSNKGCGPMLTMVLNWIPRYEYCATSGRI